tara:strand:- start:222 stop:485 length:264 start_codon:yes stop_codon:yes gene_type:complete
MYVYNYNVDSIPRCHYKWAGIRSVEPVQPVWLQTILQEHALKRDTLPQKKKIKPPSKNTVKKQGVLMYNKKGRFHYDLSHSSFETYC